MRNGCGVLFYARMLVLETLATDGLPVLGSGERVDARWEFAPASRAGECVSHRRLGRLRLWRGLGGLHRTLRRLRLLYGWRGLGILHGTLRRLRLWRVLDGALRRLGLLGGWTLRGLRRSLRSRLLRGLLGRSCKLGVLSGTLRGLRLLHRLRCRAGILVMVGVLGGLRGRLPLLGRVDRGIG